MEDGHAARLRAVFDSCDAAATGCLDREGLTELCHKLHLEAHLHLLLDSLLGGRPLARVNFERFKEHFVDLLSRSLDLSTSEDESSYLLPACPEEVQPKFVNGGKRYGRRTHPDPPRTTPPSPPSPCSSSSSPTEARRAKLPRAASLESVESLKSEEDGIQEEEGGALEEEAESQKCDDLKTSQPNTHDLLAGRSANLLYGKGLLGHGPISSSTPRRHPHPLSKKHQTLVPSPPVLLSGSGGQRLLSCLDDGSGSAAPDRVLALWTDGGVHNAQEVLQVLDFSLEERVGLCELSLALENEVLSSRNPVHQAALASYRHEIHTLQLQVEQACRQRDKVQTDLEEALRRNLHLAREVDDRHATMETLHQRRIRDLEQEYRDRLTILRSQSEQEGDVLQQQVEAERLKLRKEVELLKVQDNRLQEELNTTTQEKQSLLEELCVMEQSFVGAEQRASALQRELDGVLKDTFASLDSQCAGWTVEDRVTIRNLQTHCRELQDRNDELSSELLRIQTPVRKSRRCSADPPWSGPPAQSTGSDSDESETRRGVSPTARRKLNQPGDLVGGEDPAVSIQMELAMEQLREKHIQEVLSLRVELETKVNFYERSLELMRSSMEVERKDISQSYKLEISELEEERSRAEREVLQLKEKMEQQKGGAWSSEQERRSRREIAEVEQNYAREISHLVQRLSAEKEELGAELKLKMDQEVMLVRVEADKKLSEAALRHAEVRRQQSESWETRLSLMEQENQKEKLRVVEEEISSERRRLEERFIVLQEELKTTCHDLEESNRIIDQSERSLEQKEAELMGYEGRTLHLEAELRRSKGRSSELQETIHSLEAQEEVQNRRILERSSRELELNSMQEELARRRSREGALLHEVSGLKEQLESIQARSCILQDQQESLRSRGEEHQARLIQDLKEEQATTVDSLQQELDSRRRAIELLQDQLNKEQTSLEEEREEVGRLGEEKSRYLRLADQLSAQIVEMEEEISTLRLHLGGLSLQLNQTSDLVLELRNQLRAKSSGLTRLQEQLAHSQARLERVEASSALLHREVEHLSGRLEEQGRELSSFREGDLRSAGVQQRGAEKEEEQEVLRRRVKEEVEKDRMRQRLLEMEELVVSLEALMEPGGPHRCQVEEGKVEVSSLKERTSSLQQEVLRLEDLVDLKAKKVEVMEQEHERRREQEERLHKENSRYREEGLDLSGRNLQLSAQNAVLSSRLHSDQEAARLLREQLQRVTEEQREESAMVRELKEKEVQKEQDRLELLSSWKHERELLEKKLTSTKEELERAEVLEEEMVSLRSRQQELEQEKTRLLEEAHTRTQQVEVLHEEVRSAGGEVEALRSQLLAATQERSRHAQEVAGQHRKLQDAQQKVEELQARLQHKQEVQQTQEEHQEQEVQTLRLHNQELLQRLSAVQSLEEENQRLHQENQSLRSRHGQLESARTQAEDQAVRSDTSREVLQAQVSQQLHDARQEVEASSRQQLHLLQVRLEEQTRRSQRLEEELQSQAQQAGSQLHTHQEQQRVELDGAQDQLQQAEIKVKSLRLLLHDKSQQLQEQVSSGSRTSQLLQDVYLENSQLVKALQVTESRQKNAEKKNVVLEDKVSALNALIREMVSLALAT